MSKNNNKTILLVEDEALIALSEKKSLEKHGYDVITALSGEDAIDIARRELDLDLVLMDIDLGKGIDGSQAAQIILEQRELPVVFLSSHMEPQVVERTEIITSYGYILKNSNITVLDASIKMAFKLFEANKKLADEKEHLRTTLNSIGDAVICTDTKGNITRMNPVAEKLTGWVISEAENRPIEVVFNIVNAESRKPVESPVAKVLQYGYIVGLANHTVLISKNQNEYQIADSGSPIINSSGEITGVVLVFRDVTEDYKVQRSLKEKGNELILANEMFQKVLDSIPQFICWKDRQSVFLGCNKNYAKMVGLSDTQSIINKTDWDLPWKKEETEHFLIDDNQVMESNVPKYHIIEPAYDANGRETWLDTNKVPIHDINGEVSGIIVAFSDITERRLAMEELAYDQYLLQALLNESSDHIYFKDRDSRFIRTSKSHAKMFGLAEASQMIGKTDFDFFSFEHAHQAFADEQYIIKTGQRVIKEEKETREGYPDIWILSEKMPLLDNNGNIIGTFGISKNIDELKKTEEQLQTSEFKYNNYFDKASDGIFITDENGSYLEVNNAACLITGYSREELLQMNVSDIVTIGNTDVGMNEFRELRSRGKVSARKAFKCKDGTIRWWVMDAVKLSEKQNIAIVKDITDQKIIEEQTLSQLEEKNVIIKEIHHRIKNNMNTISSLLSLQASTLTDTKAIEALEDAINRIKSVMVLHDSLYESNNISNIPINEYLPKLINQIIGNFPGISKIKTQLDIGIFSLDSKLLHPLGLIVNELITNIMKYAFRNRDEGIIKISVHLKEDKIKVEIQDNGNGIPEGINFKNSPGFGLMLVNSLTDQLKGTIWIERRQGTKIILEFKK